MKKTALSIEFQKFHGNGNNFIFIDHEYLSIFSSFSHLQKFTQKICNRNFGVGADGVLFSDDINHTLTIINSDGSLAATCGNALRCYGLKLLRQKQWDGKSCLQIKTKEGDVFATLMEGCLDTEQISVAMGLETRAKKIPITENIWGNQPLLSVFVQLANPHLVFVSPLFESFENKDFIQFGKWAQSEFIAPFLGEIPVSNINMISGPGQGQKMNLKHVPLVVFERGAGLTLCCGSGAVASRVALETLDFMSAQDENIMFQLPGGPVEIKFCLLQEQIQRVLSGGAKYIYRGIYEWY